MKLHIPFKGFRCCCQHLLHCHYFHQLHWCLGTCYRADLPLLLSTSLPSLLWLLFLPISCTTASMLVLHHWLSSPSCRLRESSTRRQLFPACLSCSSIFTVAKPQSWFCRTVVCSPILLLQGQPRCCCWILLHHLHVAQNHLQFDLLLCAVMPSALLAVFQGLHHSFGTRACCAVSTNISTCLVVARRTPSQPPQSARPTSLASQAARCTCHVSCATFRP